MLSPTADHSSFLANSHAMNPGGDLMGFVSQYHHYMLGGDPTNAESQLSIDPAMTHAFMAMIAAMHNALADWDDMTTIEAHTKVCKPLSELMTLIHPYHLEDTGLRLEEIRAFDFPGVGN